MDRLCPLIVFLFCKQGIGFPDHVPHCAGEAKCLEGSVSQSSQCQDDLTDPSLPLVEFTAQHLLMPLTCLIFEFLAAKGPSPKARTGTM